MANTVSLNQLPTASTAPAGGVLHCYDPTQPVGLRDVGLNVTAFQGAFSAQSPNVVFAGPASGSAQVPAFRALVTADLPAPYNGTSIPVANGGTGATTAPGALTNLGAFPAAGGTMTGTAAISTTAPSLALLDTAQTGGAGRYRFIDTSGTLFIQRNTAAAGDFSTNTTPLSFSATDVGAFSARPTFAGNTPWDSGNLVFATPPAIGATTPAAGSFTSLKSTNSKVVASTTNAQSIPNNAFTTITTYTAAVNQGSNLTASTGVYVTPAAGVYDVRAGMRFTAVAGAIGSQVLIAVYVNGVQIAQAGMVQQATTAFASQAYGAWMINCAAGDSVTVRAFQNSGSAMTLDGNASANYLQIAQLV
jgi:hypothetical protein